MAHNSTSQEKVLLVGIEGVYFFENPIRMSGPFDKKWIVEQAKDSNSDRDLANRLLIEHIQYICIDRRRIDYLDKQFGYMSWPTKDSKQRFLDMLENQTKLIRHDGSCELRKIRGG